TRALARSSLCGTLRRDGDRPHQDVENQLPRKNPWFTRLLAVGLQPDGSKPEGSSPHREKPRQRGCNSTARVVGDPPSTAGLHGGGKGPGTGLKKPGGVAAGPINPHRRRVGRPPSTAGP